MAPRNHAPGCLLWLLVCSLLATRFPVSASKAENFQHQLMRELLTGYDRNIRPVHNVSQPTAVALGMSLLQILDVNMKEFQLTLSMWMRYSWMDDFLQWNVSNYGSIEYTYIPISEIWIPDVKLHNDIKDHPQEDVFANVASNGSVSYRINDVTSTSCQWDLLYFPFDRQQCRLTFGSWAFNAHHVDTVPGLVANDTSDFVGNGEWVLTGLVAEYGVKYYARFDEPFGYTTFLVSIERIPFFYVSNLLIPNILLSLLMLLGFCLPPESGERVTLSITNLLALVLFQQLVMQMMPHTPGSIPYLVYYFVSMIAITACACVASVWILSIFHHENHPSEVPNWARRLVFDYVQPCLCMGKGYAHQTATAAGAVATNKDPETNAPQTQSISDAGGVAFIGGCDKATVLRNLHFLDGPQTEEHMTERPTYRQRYLTVRTSRNIEDLLDHVKRLSVRFQEKEETKAIVAEWRELARIIDRLLLLIFAVILITAIIVIICVELSY